MLLLCLLCACGGTDSELQAALDLRSGLLAADGCRYSAQITANCGETAYVFDLTCRTEGGKTTFTVTAPEAIAGISATMAAGQTTVAYDDMVLVFDDLTAGDLSAAACPGILYSAWTEGYLSASGQEEGQTLATFLLGYDADELRVDTWLDGGTPVLAEVYSDGVKILTCAISDFAYNATTNDTN